MCTRISSVLYTHLLECNIPIKVWILSVKPCHAWKAVQEIKTAMALEIYIYMLHTSVVALQTERRRKVPSLCLTLQLKWKRIQAWFSVVYIGYTNNQQYKSVFTLQLKWKRIQAWFSTAYIGYTNKQITTQVCVYVTIEIKKNLGLIPNILYQLYMH